MNSKKIFIPRYILFSFLMTIFIWFNLIIYRFLTWKFIFPPTIQQFNSDLKTSFYVGIKYDLRVSLFIIIPIFLLSLIFYKTYFNSLRWKKFNKIYFVIIISILNLIYSVDIGNYLYLNIRLTTSIFEFFKNPLISGQMMWETYPIIKIVLGLFLLTFFQVFILKKIYNFFENKIFENKKIYKFIFALISILLISFGIYGKISWYPLRWSEAYFSKNKFISQLTLNPILNFINSFDYSSTKFDKQETEKYFPVIADYLGINPKEKLKFDKTFEPLNDSIPDAKNVVIIMMESMGAQPLGIFNNPMKGSQFIDSLAENSWFFDNFYVPRFGTARTVYASLTGLPDVVESKTASRNPSAVDQKIIFDQLKVDKKLYFLGGSANWANIRALFTNNISGIQIFEEGSYENEKRADVWGIDDYELFKNSTHELGKLHKQNKSFVAYIQSSAFHPPYTVPNKRGSFKPFTEKEINLENIKKAGFESLEHFNSLRYFDYNLKQFFDFAKKEGFYDDTVFIMFGDHNGHVLPYNHLEKPEYETTFGENHVMFMIHGKNIPKKKDSRIASIIDLFPTIADLMNQKYTNYTLGRSILRRTEKDKNFAFVFQDFHGEELPGTVWNDSYLYSTKKGNQVNPLYFYEKNKFNDKIDNPKQQKSVDSITKAIYQSTLYLYFNNKK